MAEIVIDTAKYAKPLAPDAPVRIGGTVFSARCPKGHLWYQLAQQAGRDGAGLESLDAAKVEGFVVSVFAPADAEQIEKMLSDPQNFEVDLYAMGEVYSALIEFWRPHVEAYFTEMGSGQTRAQRRALAKKAPGRALPAGRGAAKKPAAKAAAASKRR
ncbi:hypothetical protein [Streptacidiphilus cavernicola]|uniref:Tail assembly chaperone n=1 Tax=Streptacidiphilus cavernicola TaxID=3342716 RepID=A0ABV6VY97_9ACTN